MHRYYCEQPLEIDSEATIEGSEAHHLLHVMRATKGDRVALFDGSGAEFVAEVSGNSRRSVTVQIVERNEIDRELEFELVVASALPKGDRQKFLIEKLVELGTTRFVPLRTERSVVKPTDSVCERIRKSVIEASKQCGRNRLMEISNGVPLDKFLADDEPSDGEHVNAKRLIAHPYDSAIVDFNCIVEPSGRVVVAIGPEGGFADSEFKLARQSDWIPVSLGKRILRIETAAIALVARISQA